MKNLATLLCVLIVCISACKKTDTGTGTQSCRCTKFALSNGSSADTTRLTYDADGKVIKAVRNFAGGLVSIVNTTYYSDHITADKYYTFDSNTHYYTIYDLNSDGYVWKEVTSSTGSYTDSVTYQYDANGYRVKQLGSGNSFVRTYTWSGGNVVSYTTTGSDQTSATYQYYTDKAYHGRGKDYMEKYYGKMHANPEKRMDVISGGPAMTTLYGYVWDGSGNIIDELITNPDGALNTYGYVLECH